MGGRFSRSRLTPSEKDLAAYPLHSFALHGDHVSLASALLLDNRAVGTPDMLGLSPIHYAAAVGSVPCLDLLLEEGALGTVLDRCSNTPCHLAALFGQAAVLDVLVNSTPMALLATRNRCGLNVLDCADRGLFEALAAADSQQNGSPEDGTAAMAGGMAGLHDIPVHWCRRHISRSGSSSGVDLVKHQLAAAWATNQQLEAHCRQFWLAAENGDTDSIQQILTDGTGVDANTRDPFGHRTASPPQNLGEPSRQQRHTGHGLTLLHLAVANGQSEAAMRILELGADARMLDLYNGDTAVHVALRNKLEGQSEHRLMTVRVLINSGCDSMIRNNDGELPGDLLLSSDLPELPQLLTQAQANRAWIASSMGDVAVLQELADDPHRGWQANDRHPDSFLGETCLQLAIKHKQLPATMFLLHHAQPNVGDAEGNTALHVAVRHTWAYVGETVGSTEHQLIDVLLEASADPAQVNDRGVCALDLAAQGSGGAVLCSLLSAVAPDEKPDLGELARLALRWDNADGVLWLAEKQQQPYGDIDSPRLIARAMQQLPQSAAERMLANANPDALVVAVLQIAADSDDTVWSAVAEWMSRLGAEEAALIMEVLESVLLDPQSQRSAFDAIPRMQRVLHKNAVVAAKRKHLQLGSVRLLCLLGVAADEWLSQCTQLTECDSLGRSLLHYSARGGSCKMIQQVTDCSTESCGYFRGFQVADVDGRTALHHAALSPDGSSAAVWMMQQGAIRDLRDNAGMTAAELCPIGSQHIFQLIEPREWSHKSHCLFPRGFRAVAAAAAIALHAQPVLTSLQLLLASLADQILQSQHSVEAAQVTRLAELDLMFDIYPTKPHPDKVFIVDLRWFNRWQLYVNDVRAPNPGPVSNTALMNQRGVLQPGLHHQQHYVCVGPELWSLFGEKYGWQCELERPGLDVYAQDYQPLKLYKSNSSPRVSVQCSPLLSPTEKAASPDMGLTASNDVLASVQAIIDGDPSMRALVSDEAPSASSDQQPTASCAANPEEDLQLAATQEDRTGGEDASH